MPQQVSIHISESSEAQSYGPVFKHFMKQFRAIIDNPTSSRQELNTAIRGYGYFAAVSHLLQGEGGREGEREGGRERKMKGGREGGREKGGREGGKEGGRERGRKGRRVGGRERGKEGVVCI